VRFLCMSGEKVWGAFSLEKKQVLRCAQDDKRLGGSIEKMRVPLDKSEGVVKDKDLLSVF